MSDWDKVELFVIQRGFQPEYVSMESFIACMCLHYESDVENSDRDCFDYTIDEWLEYFDEDYVLEDFDYE